jgi:hypothetical protein
MKEQIRSLGRKPATSMQKTASAEPMGALAGAINSAVIATVNLVGYLAEWAAEMIVLVNLVTAAWVLVAVFALKAIKG